MEARKDLQKNIEEKIFNDIIEYINSVELNYESDDYSLVYKDLVSSGFLQITPPEEEPPKMHMLTMDSLKNFQKGNSIKPGNIRLNIRKLIDTIPNVVEMAISIATNIPVLQICSALNIWKALREVLTVEITKEQAFVIVALWKNCNQKQKITLEDGYKATNALCERFSEPKITNIKYNHTIDSLINLQCIELNEGIIWLREWVSKKYVDSI